MTPKPDSTTEGDALRRRAEARLSDEKTLREQPMSAAQTARLVHDLRVHQVELELQNEELLRARGDLEAALEKYTDLYEFAPVGYLSLDRQGAIRAANLTGATLLGCTRSQLVGSSFSLRVGDHDRAAFNDFLEAVFSHPEKTDCEVELQRQDDHRQFVRIEAAVIGQTDECRAAVSDISGRRRAEQVLREHQRLAAIGTLAGGVGHEINNPLTGILNYAQLLADGLPAEDPLHEYASEIVRESERIAGIVRSLRRFAEPDGQEHIGAVDIVDAIADALTLKRAQLRHSGIDLQVLTAPGLPTIQGRRRQIAHVVLNLLDNARAALDQRYPEAHADKLLILAAGTFTRAGGRWVRLTVEDHGSGIPEAIRERIFSPFFTTRDRTRNAGLGLTIAYTTVREHGGEIVVESEPGRFTRVHVDLPVDGIGPAGKTLELSTHLPGGP